MKLAQIFEDVVDFETKRVERDERRNVKKK